MIGTKLSGRYEIVREVGRGGMGVVYMAHDPVLDRDVAVKVISPDHVSAESVERFRREARVVAKMDHPAIVSVHDSGEQEGFLFFVMPFVEGTNLRIVLRDQSLRLGDLVDIGWQVADALDYSHSHGVIHRDIKPENIMITRRDSDSIRVRVTDFGLAMTPSQQRLTRTATIVGTVAYMSPEQIAGREAEARSDVYALGTVLYECLVGRTPFTGEVQSLLYRISHEIPIPPRALQAEIDEEVEDLLMRCLEKDPVRRPAAKELTESLSAYRMKLQTSGRIRTALPSSTTMSFQYQRPALRPFVGREKEFVELQKRMNAALAGECQFALVSGEAGIGKTRLLEELEQLSKARGIAVYHGRFVEIDRALPYQGYCEVIQEYFRSRSGTETPVDFSDLSSDLTALFPVLSEVKELVAHSGEALKSAPEGGTKKFEDRTYVFELLARTLTRMAAGKPLVLLFEDLHSADVSLDALDYIIRRLGPTPTLIVGTYRSTEVDKRHKITKLLSGFKGDRRFLSIQLGPLTPSGHRQFLEKLIGGSKLEDALVEKFYEATEGNPYFVTELVRSLQDAGGIIRDDSGICRLSSETAISSEELPVTIQQTVQERIERLSENPREILSTAAVLGKNFEFHDLEVLAPEEEDLESAIDLLMRSGFLEEDRQSRSDRFAFSSGVVRDVLYSSLPKRKRRSLHRKHAEELEKRNQGRLERVYAQLFEHYGHADVPEKVIEYGFLLAKKSLDTYSPEDAVRVTQTVIDFLQEEGVDPVAKVEAKSLLAMAYRMMGEVRLALKEIEETIAIVQKAKDRSRAISLILTAAEIAWQGLKVDDTVRWVETGTDLARSAGDSESLSKFLSLAATVANLRGEYQKAQQYLEEAAKLKVTEKAQPEEVLPGGNLTVAIPSPCLARHPANAAFNEEIELLGNVYETLVGTDASGHLYPALCERWETLNDGALFLFVIRKDVRFHDSNTLTAQLVKESFENAIRLCSQSMPLGFGAIQGVTEFVDGASKHVSGIIVLSENIVEIQLTDRLPIYPALLTDLRTAVAGERSGEGTPPGTGPFKILTSSANTFHLVRNPDYWKGVAPLVERIEFHVGLNSRDVAEGFRSGRFDLVQDLLPDDLDLILRDANLQATLVEAPRKNIYFALFSHAKELGKIHLIRQVMSGVAKMHDLVPRTIGRFAQPAEGLLPPGILGHDAGRRHSSMSVEKAKEIIHSTGHSLPIRLRAAVHPILQDRYSSFTNNLLKCWSEVGIEVSIETPDLASYNQCWVRNEGIDLLIGRWIADYDDPDNFTYGLFHSSIGEFRKYYHSNELDQWMLEARLLKQPEARERLYRRIENALLENWIFVPLFRDIDYRVAGTKVRRLALSSTAPFVNYSEVGKTETIVPVRTQKVDRGTIRIPMPSGLPGLDPSLTSTTTQAETLSAVFETLTRAAEGAQIVPNLAANFHAEEGGKRFRFQLRGSVRFHDGRRLTARDVRFSFEHLLQNENSQSRWLLAPIRGARKILNSESRELEGFRILSALDFEVELEHPLSFFPALLAYSPAAIIPEGTDRFPNRWQDGCVGTGPFRVVRFEGHILSLEANPNYWLPGFPKCEKLEFQLVCPPEEIFSGFKSGLLSIAWYLYSSDIDRLLHDKELGAKYREVPSIQTGFLAFNIKKNPFSDENLRKKVIQSIDVGKLVQTLGRFSIPARSLTPPAILGYEPRSGSRSIPEKRLVEKDIDIQLTRTYAFEGAFAPLKNELIRILNERGFRVRLSAQTSERIATEEFSESDLALISWLADYPDADTFLHGLLHRKEGLLGEMSGTAEIDTLIEKARGEADLFRRQAIYREIEDTLRSRALILPLFHQQSYCFARPEVEGLELNYFAPTIPWENLRIQR